MWESLEMSALPPPVCLETRSATAAEPWGSNPHLQQKEQSFAILGASRVLLAIPHLSPRHLGSAPSRPPWVIDFAPLSLLMG